MLAEAISSFYEADVWAFSSLWRRSFFCVGRLGVSLLSLSVWGLPINGLRSCSLRVCGARGVSDEFVSGRFERGPIALAVLWLSCESLVRKICPFVSCVVAYVCMCSCLFVGVL